MKLSKLLFPLALFSSAVCANQYQTFAQFSNHSVLGERSFQTNLLGFNHYFKPQQALGPLDKFSYINTSNRISFSTAHADHSQQYNVSGEYHFNSFIFGGSSTVLEQTDWRGNSSSYSSKLLTFGYQFNDNLVVNYSNYIDSDFEASNSVTQIKYEHSINDNEYMGLNVTFAEDYVALGGEAFMSLANGQYLSVTGGTSSYEGEVSDYSLGVDYFMSENTSLSLGSRTHIDNIENEFDWYSIGMKHFFNENWASKVTYRHYPNSLNGNDGIMEVSISAQF